MAEPFGGRTIALGARREPKARLHLPLYILIALYTGARRGAVLGLRWSQIDLVK
jgi:integrase